MITSLTQLALETEMAFWNAMAINKLDSTCVTAISTGLPDAPGLNLVIDAQLNAGTVDAEIGRVIDFFAIQQLAWSWYLGPLTKPYNLAEHLLKHNLVYQENFPGMYFNLQKNFSNKPLNDFTIIEAIDLQQWSEIIGDAFAASDNGIAYGHLNTGIPHGPDTAFRHYVGYYQDKAVGAGTLFLTDNASMIHNLATKTDFLKRGFGTAMLSHLMQTAKNLQKQHCFLDASDSGASLYKKIGFELYCYYNVYGFSEC